MAFEDKIVDVNNELHDIRTKVSQPKKRRHGNTLR